MPLFRCTGRQCRSFDFEADAALCPRCGNPECQALVTIHYDPPHRKDPRKRANEAACQPGRSLAGLTTTSETGVVNCPRCLVILAAEEVRRRGTDGSFTLKGPPEATGPVVTESVTYAGSGGTDVSVKARGK